MTNDKNGPTKDDLPQQLNFILDVFGRKQEPGEALLESLPPSERLIPNSPLTKEERNVIFWADSRFYGIRPALKDDSVSRQKTLAELFHESGIKEAAPDEPIYLTPYSISLPTFSQRPIPQPQQSSETSGSLGLSQKPLIDRNSKEPQDRQKFIRHLAAMLVAFRSPQEMLESRVRVAALLAQKDGLNWKDLYQAAKSGLPSRYPQPPSEKLVDPES